MAAMWKRDGTGEEFDLLVDALRALRKRAERVIREADRQGQDARSLSVRLRDDQGAVMFEGTLAEAAKLYIMSLYATFLVASYTVLTTSDVSTLTEIFA